MASTVEIIKRFFNNNGYQYYDMVDTAGGRRSISICKEGFVFGKVENNGGWLINKTFINKDLAHDHQNDLEASMVAELKQDRFKTIAATYFDVAAYEIYVTR